MNTLVVQFHWQHYLDTHLTKFVAQSPELASQEEYEAWVNGVFERHAAERPEGYSLLICTAGSAPFISSPAL